MFATYKENITIEPLQKRELRFPIARANVFYNKQFE